MLSIKYYYIEVYAFNIYKTNKDINTKITWNNNFKLINRVELCLMYILFYIFVDISSYVEDIFAVMCWIGSKLMALMDPCGRMSFKVWRRVYMYCGWI